MFILYKANIDGAHETATSQTVTPKCFICPVRKSVCLLPCGVIDGVHITVYIHINGVQTARGYLCHSLRLCSYLNATSQLFYIFTHSGTQIYLSNITTRIYLSSINDHVLFEPH